jgi:hypothetical protein
VEQKYGCVAARRVPTGLSESVDVQGGGVFKRGCCVVITFESYIHTIHTYIHSNNNYE